LEKKEDSLKPTPPRHASKWSEYYVPEPESSDDDEWNDTVIEGLKRLRKLD
jgi:hypothetical protein